MNTEAGPEDRDRLSRRPGSADNRDPAKHAAEPAHARSWLLLLGGGLLLTILYIVMPYGPMAGALYVAVSLGAAILVALAVFRRPLASSTACILLACGLALTAAGHSIWYWLDFQGLEPFGSIADVIYLAAYPLFMGALWTLGRQGIHDSDAIVDALIVGIAAAVLGWAVLIEPYMDDPHLGLLPLIVATAYPVADLILLPLIAWLLFLHRARIRAHQFLLAGMIVYLAADVLYAHGNSTGWYAPGGFTDGLWLVGYALFTAAVWHPSAATETRFERVRAELTTGRLVLLATAALVVPAVIVVTAGTDVQLVRIAAIGSILLFALVMIRMAGLMNRIRRQAERFESLARTDPLTGAINRRAFEQELAREIARAERSRTPLCLAFLDLDHFKRYNDTNGHAAGDTLLRDMAAAWRGALHCARRMYWPVSAARSSSWFFPIPESRRAGQWSNASAPSCRTARPARRGLRAFSMAKPPIPCSAAPMGRCMQRRMVAAIRRASLMSVWPRKTNCSQSSNSEFTPFWVAAVFLL